MIPVMEAIGSILLTTDFSETSAKAFAVAKGLAAKFGARIAVVHVEDDRVSPLLVEYMAVGLESIRQRDGYLVVAVLNGDGPIKAVLVLVRTVDVLDSQGQGHRIFSLGINLHPEC